MKTEQDYIKAAVELADGWKLVNSVAYPPWHHTSPAMDVRNPSTILLDALAAQLVRQVDALGAYFVCKHDFASAGPDRDDEDKDTVIKGPDRTMNTIKAIVDSGVLKDE